MTLAITSTAFAHEGAIPKKYTCEGADISPPLEWTGVPTGVKSFALIVDDPDAPDPKAPKMTYVHWVLFNIPPDTRNLLEDEAEKGVPDGAVQGLNDWKRTGYGGPCPPIGRHRYFFKLYVLDTLLPILEKPTKSAVLEAMKGHILAEAQLMGTYQKEK